MSHLEAVLPSRGDDGLFAASVDGANDGILRSHAPILTVVVGDNDFLAEEGAHAEGAHVLVDVGKELLLGRVRGVAAREGHERQLTVELG
jgi:hypothetical protein